MRYFLLITSVFVFTAQDAQAEINCDDVEFIEAESTENEDEDEGGAGND